MEKEIEKKFYWHYESVLDHNITPEEFKEVTGFDWSERLDYLEGIVDGPYQGFLDIGSYYSIIKNDENKARHYYNLYDTNAIQYIDECL